MTTKATKLSLMERFQKAEEAEMRSKRNILKDQLKDNTQFAAVTDVRNKLNRSKRECESYLSDEGQVKHRARIQAKIDRATAELETLNAKAQIARDSLPGIAAHIAAIDASLQNVGAFLTENLDATAFESNETLNQVAANAVEAGNFGDLTAVVDPFAEYRTKRADTEETEEASDED